MLNEKMYQFWLSNIEGIGPRKYKALIEHCNTASNVFQCGREDLLGIPSISAKDVNRIVALRNEDIIIKKYNELSKKGVRFVSQDDEEYPSLLLQMYDPPIGLYVKGRMPEVDQKCIAIVGARECSQVR